VARRFPGATLVEVANSVHGELRIAWEKRPQATATLEGAIGGRELRATMPAP
jgi:hypothetical protein